MDLDTLRNFFMCCSIINGVLFAFWAVMILCCRDWVYRTQRRWLPVPRETFDVVMYCFMGLFKVVYIVFNLTPFIVLSIIK